MIDFDVLCKQYESLDPVAFESVFDEKATVVAEILRPITVDEFNGVQIFSCFIIETVMSEGKLGKKEYELIKPVICTIHGSKVSHKEAEEIFEAIKKDFKNERYVVDLMKEVMNKVSEDTQNDIIQITMMICAVDGKISYKEQNWVKQLIE